MCRMLGYVGPPRDLASLLVEPPHALHEQSWAPRDQSHGTVNADGWGVGWYADGRAEPARYRSVLPMWSDPHLATLLPAVTSGQVVGVVRSATPPLATDLSATPPFASGRWLLAHNGAVEGWRDGVGEQLRRSLPIGRAAALESGTDTEVVFALVLAELDAGAAPADALAAAIAAVLAVAPARLNLLLGDGTSLWATRRGDVLSVRHDGGATATWIASEPDDDDPAWEVVPEDHVVHAGAHGVTVQPIGTGRRTS